MADAQRTQSSNATCPVCGRSGDCCLARDRLNQAVNHLEAVLEEHARVGLGGDGDAQQVLVQAMHFVEAHLGRLLESRRVLLGEVSYDELHWSGENAV